MSQMASSSPEYNIARTYVENLLEIPWNVFTEDRLDVSAARAILEAEHSGLEKVKRRILEFLAVRKLAPNKHGPILLLVGPPGVGKTSLGQSIASVARPQVRPHLARRRARRGRDPRPPPHVHRRPPRPHRRGPQEGRLDEPGVRARRDRQARCGHAGRPGRGHARGPRPRAEQGLRRSLRRGAGRPLEGHVHLHREPARHDQPAAARSHGDGRALRLHDASRSSRSRRTTSCPSSSASTASARTSSSSTTRPSRTSSTATRARPASVTSSARSRRSAAAPRSRSPRARRTSTSTKPMLEELLGPPRYVSDTAERKPEVGVITGLAWTPVGGDIMFIEARIYPGKGDVRLTGQMGDVMKESAHGRRVVDARERGPPRHRSRQDREQRPPHPPAAGRDQEGRPVGRRRADLRGRLGVHAAARSATTSRSPARSTCAATRCRSAASRRRSSRRTAPASRSCSCPERNQKDTLDIPEEVRNELDIRFMTKIDDALDVALGDAPPPTEPEPAIPPPTAPVARLDAASACRASLRRSRPGSGLRDQLVDRAGELDDVELAVGVDRRTS